MSKIGNSTIAVLYFYAKGCSGGYSVVAGILHYRSIVSSVSDPNGNFSVIDGTWGSTSRVLGPTVDTYVEYD